MQDLTQWLSEIGLEQYAPAMLSNDIDFDLLQEITDADLKEIGLSIGHIRRLLAAVRQIQAATPDSGLEPTVSIANATEPLADNAEHRQLTVMFCDLAESTEMSQTLSSEDLREVTLDYQAACKEAIESHEGFIARYMGDGLLVYFGYPEAHEDDAKLAVEAGLAIVESIQTLNDRIEPSKGVRLAVRVGIATGPVIVGDIIGKGPSRESAVVGETPNLSARLQGLATLNGVVVSPSTYRLTKRYFEFIPLGQKNIKGFRQPIETWQVERKTSIEEQYQEVPQDTLTPLIGREEETEILLRRWKLSKQGNGQVVFLSGEPGIGKSRLVQNLRNQTKSEHHIRLRYQCSQHHTNSPLFPFIQQFEYSAGFEHGDTNGQKLDKLVALAKQMGDTNDSSLPLLASLLAINLDERVQPFQGDSRQRRAATHEMFQHQLDLLIAKGPVLIVFEDLHWIDPSSLELLDRLIERINEMPVMMVLAFRPDFHCPWTGLSHSMFLALNRIGKKDSLAIVEKMTAGKGFTDDLIRHIVSRTDGVPLFVEEMTKMLMESQHRETSSDARNSEGETDSSQPPETLRDSLTARLDRLGSAKSIAQICSVIGRRVNYRLLEKVADMQANQLNEELRKLTEVGLMSCRGGAPDAFYTFKHALIQDTAYQSMLSARRIAIHSQIADTMQKHFEQDVLLRPEVIAHHYYLSERFPQALDYFKRGATRMLERSNYIEGIYYLNQALNIVESEPESPERDAKEIGVQIPLGGAMIATKGFAAEETGNIYKRAAELYKRVGGDSNRFNPVRYGVFVFHLVRSEFDIAHECALEFFSVAESQNDATEHLVARRTLGSCLTFLGHWNQSVEQLERSLSMYDRDLHGNLAVIYAQDPRIAALSLLSWSLLHLGRYDEALASADTAVKEAYEFDHLHTTAYTLGIAGTMFHQIRGDIQRTREGADALVKLCSAQPVPLWSNLGALLQGWAIGMAGDIDAGINQMQEGYAGFASTGARLFLPYYKALKAQVFVKGGKFQQAITALQEAHTLQAAKAEGWFAVDLHRISGDLHLQMDMKEQAKSDYQAGLKLAIDTDDLLNQLRCTMGIAESDARTGSKGSVQIQLEEIVGKFPQSEQVPDIIRARDMLGSL